MNQNYCGNHDIETNIILKHKESSKPNTITFEVSGKCGCYVGDIELKMPKIIY